MNPKYQFGFVIDKSEPNKREVLDKGFIHLVSFNSNDEFPLKCFKFFRAGKQGSIKSISLSQCVEYGQVEILELLQFVFHIKAPLYLMYRFMPYVNQACDFKIRIEEHRIPEQSQVQKKYQFNVSGRPNFVALSENWSTERRERIPDIGTWHDQVAYCVSNNGKQGYKNYKELIALGVTHDIAGSAIPTSTYTETIVQFNGLELARFLEKLYQAQRQAEECVRYAEAMLHIFSNTHPGYVEALQNHFLPKNSETDN